MITQAELIEIARENAMPSSDYRLARLTGVSTKVLSGVRHGTHNLNDKHVVALSKIAKIEEGYALACIHAERSKQPETRAAWERVAQRFAAGIALCAAIIVPLLPDLIGWQCILCKVVDSAFFAKLLARTIRYREKLAWA